jgi:hypothetical protein
MFFEKIGKITENCDHNIDPCKIAIIELPSGKTGTQFRIGSDFNETRFPITDDIFLKLRLLKWFLFWKSYRVVLFNQDQKDTRTGFDFAILNGCQNEQLKFAGVLAKTLSEVFNLCVKILFQSALIETKNGRQNLLTIDPWSRGWKNAFSWPLWEPSINIK